MAEDWAKNVRKYAKGAEDAVIAGIVRYCGIALTKKDSALVSFSDPKELDRVKAGFMRKKMALTQPEAALDAALAKVAETMKADRTKNRVTVYYLLAQEFGKLEMFRTKTKAAAATPAKAPAAKAEKAPAKAPAKSAAAAAPAAKAPAKTAPKPATKAAPKPAAKATPAKKAAAAPSKPKAKAPAKPKASAAKPATAPAATVAAPQAVMTAPTPTPATTAPAAAPATAASVSPKAATAAAPAASSEESGLGWLPWVLGLILLAFLLWWLTS